jgi:zinc ribbon protein
MSSETSTKNDQLQPWQLFTLAGLAGATAVVFVAKDGGPAGVILLSLTVGAAAFAGVSAWRTLAPLAGIHVTRPAQMLGGRTRAALERDKVLVLRAIKDLEFDRAMGKVSEKDFEDMSVRLRSRAASILRELDRASTHRDEIEREVSKRLGAPAALPAKAVAACACGTKNDADARFCKNCGRSLA